MQDKELNGTEMRSLKAMALRSAVKAENSEFMGCRLEVVSRTTNAQVKGQRKRVIQLAIGDTDTHKLNHAGQLRNSVHFWTFSQADRKGERLREERHTTDVSMRDNADGQSISSKNAQHMQNVCNVLGNSKISLEFLLNCSQNLEPRIGKREVEFDDEAGQGRG